MRGKCVRHLLLSAALAALLTTGGCGFKLRGPQPLAFATLYVGVDPNSPLGAGLRRHISTSGTTAVVEEPAQAQARLEIVRNTRAREILSLSSAGTVREYQLRQTLTFLLISRDGERLLPETSISAQREYNFDDARVIGKEQEEALLYRDMEHDLQQQLMRRLAAVQR